MAIFSIQVCSLSFFVGRREYTGPAPAWFYGISPRSSYRKSVLPLLAVVQSALFLLSEVH